MSVSFHDNFLEQVTLKTGDETKNVTDVTFPAGIMLHLHSNIIPVQMSGITLFAISFFIHPLRLTEAVGVPSEK